MGIFKLISRNKSDNDMAKHEKLRNDKQNFNSLQNTKLKCNRSIKGLEQTKEDTYYKKAISKVVIYR